jgi:hypothetical protein
MKLCASCRRPAVAMKAGANGIRLWKCQSCLDRKTRVNWGSKQVYQREAK